MFKEVIEGRFEGRRPRGRKRKSLLDDLKGNRSYHQLKRLPQDRRAWQMTDPSVDLPLGRTQDDDDDGSGQAMLYHAHSGTAGIDV